MSIYELHNDIIDACYRLEAFMNGQIKRYEYFGFKKHFKEFLELSVLPKYVNPQRATQIEYLWKLLDEYQYQYDKGEYDGIEYALQNESFVKDMEEISFVHWDMVENLYPSLGKIEPKRTVENLEPIKANTNILIDKRQKELRLKLTEYGFYNLDKVRILTPKAQQELTEKICESKKPFIIALFNYLGFINLLEKTFATKYKMYQEIASWLGGDKEGRDIKGYILSFTKRKENDRYNAFLHEEEVKEYYQSIK